MSIHSPAAAAAPAVPSLVSLHHRATILSVDGARRLLRRLLAAVRASWPGVLAVGGVAASTWISFRLGQSFAFTGFLHLVLVVLAAMYGGFWQATLTSVIAAACLNYFFVPPIFSFINSPANWAALGAFEFTALVISRLSLRARHQALEAIARRRDMEQLYETSRRILLLGNSPDPGGRITALIRETFDLRGVHLFDALSCAAYRNGECDDATDRRVRDVYFRDTGIFESATATWYRPLRLGRRSVGGLALCGAGMSEVAATALASLTAIALERARSLQRESRAEAARQTEQLRTAVLDALAHQFKTPLAVARTASSGLLAVGGLSDLQAELITVIDRQAKTLDHLAACLLRTAMLDSTEFKPQCERLSFSQVVADAVGKLDPGDGRDRFHLSRPAREVPVFADRELLLTVLAQLIDNALKYSQPESAIHLAVATEERDVVFTIRTKGLVVSPQDCERIFERFYRAPETLHLPAGSGLGLSIVKRIVTAHHGSVWATGETGFGTSFSISLPAAADK